MVNLPTGHGKSLCSQVVGVLSSSNGQAAGVTIVVVPTVALCIDQADAVQAVLGHEAAYHGGSSDETHMRNREIRARIVNGTQGIVFTSPESLVEGPLHGAVYEAARRGLLRLLVIDEAHIVSQWGDGFRPAFQELSGLRRGLLRESPGKPFRTLLLSATLTQACIETLAALFSGPGQLAMVSAAQLRPEPSYWAAYCHARADKEECILEAVRHLPRPLILYTTKVEDANAWYRRLFDAGYRRLAVVTGKTDTAAREAIVRQWANRELDIVVATSAFGLGVDQPDVRAVVHACIPETLDRLYQEVGRGGRDGCASVSLVIYTQEDWKIAGSLGRKRLISLDKGMRRWDRMFRTKSPGRALEDAFEVRLDTAPGMDERYIDMVNETSTEWSAHTLTLMCRSGLLELDDEAPSACAGEEGPFEPRDPNSRLVRVLDQGHLRRERWEERVEPYRVRARIAQARMMRLMDDFVAGSRCIANILAEAYSVEGNGVVEAVPVARACGGCEHCRKHGTEPYALPAPRSAVPWGPQANVGDRLRALIGAGHMLGVTYSTHSSSVEVVREFCKLVSWGMAQGVAYLVAPREILNVVAERVSRLREAAFFWDDAYEERTAPSIPSIVFQADGEAAGLRHWLRAARNHSTPRPPTILVFADTVADPDRPDRLVKDIIACPCVSLTEFKARENI